MSPNNLEIRLERIEAIRDIQNMMGSYEFLLAAKKTREIKSLFANREDVTWDIADLGVFKGEAIMKESPMGEDSAGFWAELALTTSVIEVAGDGKTAKAVWMAPGFETAKDKTGKMHSCWVWYKYACDFIKEKGAWKFWHLKAFLVFCSDYYKSWVEEADEHWFRRPSGQPPFKGASPSVFRHLPYDKNLKPVLLPAFPKPYQTYDGSMDWIDPEKPTSQ